MLDSIQGRGPGIAFIPCALPELEACMEFEVHGNDSLKVIHIYHQECLFNPAEVFDKIVTDEVF